jgi:hypothetical protein
MRAFVLDWRHSLVSGFSTAGNSFVLDRVSDPDG